MYMGKSKYPFWFDNDLKKKLQSKERARRKCKKSGLDEDYSTFSNFRRECKIKIEECYSTYLKSLQSNIKTNIKLFWAFTKKKNTLIVIHRNLNSTRTLHQVTRKFAICSPLILSLLTMTVHQTVQPTSQIPFNHKPINHSTSLELMLNQ